MNPEIKQLWIDALRSGDYEQGAGALSYRGKHCCLGVLCELAVDAGIISKENNPQEGDLHVILYDGESATLPLSVQQWANMQSGSGATRDLLPDDEPLFLTEMNDHVGLSFDEIADVIGYAF